MSQNQSHSQSQRSEAFRDACQTSLPNEIECIWYSEIVAMQSQLNNIVGLLKRSKELRKREIWETLIHKYKDLKAAHCQLNMIAQAVEWDMGGREQYACGDG